MFRRVSLISTAMFSKNFEKEKHSKYLEKHHCLHLMPFNVLNVVFFILTLSPFHEAPKATMQGGLVTLPMILTQEPQALSKINYPDLQD